MLAFFFFSQSSLILAGSAANNRKTNDNVAWGYTYMTITFYYIIFVLVCQKLGGTHGQGTQGQGTHGQGTHGQGTCQEVHWPE